MRNFDLKTVLSLCLSVFVPVAANAEETDSIENTYFNAMEYVQQQRYIPKGRLVKRDAPGHNWTLGILGGVGNFVGSASGQPDLAEFGLSIQKEVNSFNSYRLSFLGGINDVQKRASVEFDHIFNIQDYLFGYRKNNVFNVSTVVGLGAYMVFPEGSERKIAGSLHGGLRLSRMFTQNLEVYVEPKVHLFTDDIEAVESPRRYNFGTELIAGLTYHFTEIPIRRYPNLDPCDQLFYELYMGAQGDFSDRVKENMSSSKCWGPAMGLSVGKWWMPLGMRATAFGGMHYVPNDVYTGISEEPYAGLRLEGMVNLNTFFFPRSREPKFEINAMAGYELGVVAHRATTAYSKKVRPFHGPTFAGQLLYAVNDKWGVFAQARWSGSRYEQPFVDGSVEKRKMDNFSLEFGVQYRRRSRKMNLDNAKFEPYSFVMAGLGGNFPVRFASVDFDKPLTYLGQQYTISLGRRFTPYSSVRASLMAGRYAYGKDKGTYPLSISADWMFDMFTAVAGYDQDRTFNVAPFIGIVYTHHETADKNLFGGQIGLNEHFRLNDRWGIYLEQAAQVYDGKITESARTFWKNRFSMVLSTSAGLTYRF